MNQPRAESSSVQPSCRLSSTFIQSVLLSIEEWFLDFIYEERQNHLEPGCIGVRDHLFASTGLIVMVSHGPSTGMLEWVEMGTVTEALKGPVSGTLALSMMCAYFSSFSSQRRAELHIPGQHQRPSSSQIQLTSLFLLLPPTQDP